MALFLRYCASCNVTAPPVDNRGKCAECGEPLKIVDAMALIPSFGEKMSVGDRVNSLDDCTGHDLP